MNINAADRTGKVPHPLNGSRPSPIYSFGRRQALPLSDQYANRICTAEIGLAEHTSKLNPIWSNLSTDRPFDVGRAPMPLIGPRQDCGHVPAICFEGVPIPVFRPFANRNRIPKLGPRSEERRVGKECRSR